MLHFKRRVVLTVTGKNILSMATQVDEDSIDEGDEQKDDMWKCSVRVAESGVRIREFHKFEPQGILQAFKLVCESLPKFTHHTEKNIRSENESAGPPVQNALEGNEEDLLA